MTNYSKWDSKASALERELKEEEEREKAENDKALGLEGGPKGPPTAKAEQEREELGQHSEKRKEFIDWSNQREVGVTHKASDEPVVLDGEEVKGKCVRISGSEDVTYRVPEGSGVVKLCLDKCRRVNVQVNEILITSTIEAYRCEEVELQLHTPIGVLQVDECEQPLRVCYADREHVGVVYHQNSPGLTLGWGFGADAEVHAIGAAGAVQLCSRLASGNSAEPVHTAPVRRGEGEFPLDLPNMNDSPGTTAAEQPEPEAAPAAEEMRRQAEEKRLRGNDMFRASDFLQAAMEYTEAIRLDPSMSALWANRSQCWLKLGDHDKALADAEKCIEVDPSNAKGWFRKGMSFHAMKQYPEAIPALLEAEKLEPNNKQIPEAIKMAQMMARRQAGG